ncbi:MAG: leucine-rich repeat domain-containing protein, partial [Clostridia bacterium]|nr:leucine-rich repeat domain-containing protein [Clostridia bacterium]
GGVDLDWYEENPAATEFTLNSSEDLAGLAAIVNGTAEASSTGYMSTRTSTLKDDFKDKTIKLNADLDLKNVPWTPIGTNPNPFRGNFDGQNHTISNLDVDNAGWAGLFGHVGLGVGSTIENVKVVNATIRSNRMAGVIVGQMYGDVKNCHVSNADITVVPDLQSDGKYDNGDKVGGIVGWLGDNGNNRVLDGCSVENVTIAAYRDVGGIAGYVASSTTVSNNVVKGENTIAANQLINNYGQKEVNAGAVYGRTGGDITDINNQVIETEEAKTEVTGIYKDAKGIQYVEEADEVYLYLIPADYQESTVKVSEGVTKIGNYAFAYNNNVKTVELASTVTDLGRGFDSSTVEKVVLNEGLETVSSRAFRRTYNLQEVVISSTVTTIADNAFQSSGIKNIVFPANVSYIGDSCFTAAQVEKVTIEGKNVEIAHYAFRDCPNLTSVTILSDTVTLGEGQIFTNTQNNNQTPNKITIYVKNEAVKAAIEANGTFEGAIVVMKEVAKDENISNSLANSLTDGADTVYLPAGDYTSFSANANMGADDTIICAEGTLFEGTSSLNVNGATIIGGNFKNDSGYAVSGTIDGTFKDCVFESSETLRWCYTTAGESVVFENCVFKTDFRGVHFDEMNGNVTFRNCEINGFNAYSGTGTMTFENCTFGYDESYYNGLNIYTDTNLINCTFNYKSGKSDFIDMEGTGKTLNITNCVATQDGETINIISKIGGSQLAQNKVIIDGTPVVNSTAGLKEAIVDNATVIVREGDYEMSTCANNVTFAGMSEAGTKINYTIQHSGMSKGSIWRETHFKNLTFVNTVLTMADGGNSTFEDVTFAAGFRNGYGKAVKFTDCTFGSNSEGYALHFQTDSSSEGGLIVLNDCEFEGGKVHLGGKRAYAFTGCDFAAGTDFQVWSNVTLIGCTVDGVAITAENVATFFPKLDLAKVSFGA